MKRAIFLFATVALGLSACASPQLEIREVGGAHQDLSDGTTDGRVALGLTQLAMGNVGLALESFRRANREDPQSYRALQGLAECYLQLGKPSIARRSLEQALALRPDVPELYRALAAAAQGEGKPAEAAALRREAQARMAAKMPPPAAPAALAALTPSAPAVQPPAAPVAPALATPLAPAPAAPVAPALAAPTALASVVPVAMAPAKPAAPPPAPAPKIAPAVRSSPQPVSVDLAIEAIRDKGPRLVRLSLGEVALMTRPGSPFASAPRVADTTVHAPLRILNAARVQGIAARTRTMLAAKGLRGADIGDAPARRQNSEIRYAKADAQRAQALAARLPFRVLLVERDGPLTLLVGRNAAP